MKIKTTMGRILAFHLFILLAACAPAALEENGKLQQEEPADETEAEMKATSTPVPDRTIRLEELEMTKQVEQVPPMDAPAVVGEVPRELMEAILDDLVEQVNADREDVEILRAEQAIWADGSLGCPQPGEMYTQASIQGYWVNLGYQGVSYDYRANDQGFFILCESPLPGSRGAPTG